MTFRKMALAMALLLPASAFAQKEQIRELQREVAELTDLVRAMQRSSDERSGEFRTLVQQAIDAAGNQTVKSETVFVEE